MDQLSLAFSRLVLSANQLGACVSNLSLTYGEFGRGLRCPSNEFQCRIPSSFYFPIKAVRLNGSALEYDPTILLPRVYTSSNQQLLIASYMVLIRLYSVILNSRNGYCFGTY